jgi:cytochrome c peroxidase
MISRLRSVSLAVACFAATAGASVSGEIETPLGLPSPPPALVGSPAMRRLGERLFFDRGLSANGTLSCAMCHIPTQGYASNQSALSIGMEGKTLRRNAPSLYNVVFKKYLFHDGRETDLVAQVWGPLLAADEMGNLGVGPLLDRLRRDPAYGPAFAEAFPGDGVTMITLGRAIAAFEATLLRSDTGFDRAYFGGDAHALTPLERRGFEVFLAKGCAQCHTVGERDALFLDQSWHNTGVAFAARAASKARVELAPGVSTEVDVSAIGLVPAQGRSDLGRFDITRDPKDRWAFVTPTLRGVRDSAPYMHDGSLKTLEEVVEFYDRGGGANPALDPKIKPLGLSDDEKRALAAFLAAL